MIHAFQNTVSYLCFAALAVIACMCLFAGLRQVGRWLRANLCPISLVVFAAAAVIATCKAQKRGGEGGSGASAQPIVQSLPGAETNAKWRAHGAFQDVFYLPASNWWARMPGGGWIDRLRVRSSGRFQAKGAAGGSWTNYPPPFAQKLSLAPEANWTLPSLFWHATTPSNTLVMTWLGGLYARSHTNQVDFQAELFNDGSYDYRYADHTEHFAASLPFDLDGDGLENSVDPDPLTPGSDAHGTNAEWYNTVCSNVFEAVATSCDPPGPGAGGAQLVAPVELSWREGVNSNAYYFVDVVTERGPAPIYFTGDRDSRLGNPVVVARAFETNRVPLLIGVDYSVTSDTPFTVSYPMEYMYPEVETNEPCRAHIRWPLNFVFTESIGASNRVYTVTVEPYDPGGVFEWGDSGGGVPMRGGSSGGGCSCVSYGINSVWFTCSSSGMCESGCSAHGSYLLEAASFSVDGGECRCGFDDPPPDDPETSSHEPNEPPSLTITFSEQAVLFEDAFENSPGVTEPRRSTRVRLTIDAYGGAQGGSLWISDMNMVKLTPIGDGVSLPYSQVLAAGESYHATGVYEGVLASGSANDVKVSGSLTETGTGGSVDDFSAMTVVRVALIPRVTAPRNEMLHRHSYGVRELVQYIQEPSEPVVSWNPVGGGANENHAGNVFFRCPLDGCENPLRAEIGTVHYSPKVKVIEPEGIESKTFGHVVYSNAVHKGEAGGIGMKLYMYVTPLDVSFSEIAVEEVPCLTYEASGYFQNPYYNGAFSHTRQAGAGNWMNVLVNDNKLDGYDTAAYHDKIPWLTPTGMVTTDTAYSWTDGCVYVDNPFGWNVKDTQGEAIPHEQFGEDIYATFMLDGNGRVGVFKLDNWVSRTTNDVINLYGPKDAKNEE